MCHIQANWIKSLNFNSKLLFQNRISFLLFKIDYCNVKVAASHASSAGGVYFCCELVNIHPMTYATREFWQINSYHFALQDVHVSLKLCLSKSFQNILNVIKFQNHQFQGLMMLHFFKISIMQTFSIICIALVKSTCVFSCHFHYFTM